MTSAPANPLLAPWADALGLPPFDRIRPEHFRPAFDAAMTEQKRAVGTIADNPAAPTFDNTIVALERSGLPLGRIAATFFHLAGADTNEALQAVEREIAPRLAGHRSDIHLDATLFGRIETLWRGRETAELGTEEMRVLERTRTNFVRAGAALDAAGKQRLKEIAERLAALGTRFSQNVLVDERAFTLVLDGEADLAGLPESVRAAAAEAATERGLAGKHVVTLSRSSIVPFLTFSTRRDLREKAFAAWVVRGEGGGDTDNRALISEMVAMRAERARLLGYESFAHYRLADTMAKTPEAVSALLGSVWRRARERAAREESELQALVAAEGGNFALAAWDWRHYAERLRRRGFDLDGDGIEAYLQLDNVIAAAFDTARRLFGLSFEEVKGLPLYNGDVRVWTVAGRDGRPLGVFVGDYFARPSKRSGAWAGSLRDQHRLDGDQRPIIVNTMNFAKAPKGRPTLLSFEDARTLFHEFGHALHGLLSDVTYPVLWGTRVPRDFVELPSQLYEHWLAEPEVLGRFAIHAETGEAMPRALIDKLIAGRTFNQGWATVEYTASALVDLDLHLLPTPEGVDVVEFEKQTLGRIGMPAAIAMRHRTPHFAHVFAGDYYAAGYYSYLWSEVLDADAFDAFRETGDPFDQETARRLHDHIYSAGNRRDPADAYVAFRGRMPTPAALMRKRGLGGEAVG